MKKMNIMLCLTLCLLMTSCQAVQEPFKTNQPEETTVYCQETVVNTSQTTDTETEPITTPTSAESATVPTPPPLPAPSIPVYEGNDGLYDCNTSIGDHSNLINLMYDTEPKYTPSDTVKTVSVNGETWTVYYGGRIIYPYYNQDLLEYGMIETCPDTGKDLRTFAWFSTDTGKLIKFAHFYRSFTGLSVLSKEECMSIAENYLHESLNISGDYRLTSEEYTYNKENSNGRYQLLYRRFVGGIETMETVSVGIDHFGRIIAFNAFMLDSMNGVELPEYDEAEVMAALEYKIADVYKNEDNYSYSYRIKDPWLTRLKDGQLYLRYCVDVTLETLDGSPSPACGQELLLLVPIG